VPPAKPSTTPAIMPSTTTARARSRRMNTTTQPPRPALNSPTLATSTHGTTISRATDRHSPPLSNAVSKT
jgi:hypothetical protein